MLYYVCCDCCRTSSDKSSNQTSETGTIDLGVFVCVRVCFERARESVCVFCRLRPDETNTLRQLFVARFMRGTPA